MRDAASLDREGAFELSQTRVTDAGVAQRRRVDRQRLEILERQHALEPRQRLVPACSGPARPCRDRSARAPVETGRRPAAAAATTSFSRDLGLRPLSEPHSELPVEPGDIELDLTGVRRDAPRGVERGERVGETILAALNEGLEIFLARAKRSRTRPRPEGAR